MKKLRLALLAATAATLVSAGAASAQVIPSNEVFLEQNGSSNSANIDQTGGENNNVGTSGLYARQTNDADTESNSLTITQSQNGNSVESLVQNAESGAGTNTLTITQQNNSSSTANNSVTSAGQNVLAGSTGDNIATLSQDGENNKVSLSQANSGNLDNTVTLSVTGNLNGNSAFTSGGYASLAESAGSTSSALIQNGTDNEIDLTITGNDNRFGVNQQGDNNDLSVLTINNNLNELGIYQNSVFGGSNELNITGIDGPSNNVGVVQLGGGANVGTIALGAGTPGSEGNKVFLQQIDGANATITVDNGNFNDINANQSGAGTSVNPNNATIFVAGSTNTIDLDQTGDDNLANIDALGSLNDVTVSQTGDENVADVDANGSTNSLTVNQLDNGQTATLNVANGSGNVINADQRLDSSSGSTGNTLTVNVFGNNNGAGTISGVASATLASSAALSSGDLFQSGSGNTATWNFGASGDLASSNQFAMLQSGDNNSVTASVKGSLNEAVVVQTGNSNISNFSQNGTSNVAAITQ